MPKHIIRLLLLVGFAFFMFLFARSIFVEDSFGAFGHYRGAAVAELAFPPPVYKTATYCQLCHFDLHARWHQANHKSVQCETCHTAAEDHPARGKLPIPQHTVTLCIACHEAQPGRPREFPQIVMRLHLAGQGTPQQCNACHDSHVPERLRKPEVKASAAGGGESAGAAPADVPKAEGAK
jgi:hypothetical protein